jgi:sulfite exporter TauE/SafE
VFEYNFLSLFLAGLLGGGHCVAMCGGIVSAMTFSSPQRHASWPFILLFNMGRIASYMLVGAIAGTLGNGLQLLPQLHLMQTALYLLANLILIGLGLYVAGISTLVTRIERLGTPIWRQLQPLTRRLLPVRYWYQALAMGALWGWIPCGLVYTALLGALASGSGSTGAALMLAFGMGTLPNLLLIAASGRRFGALMVKPVWRRFAGTLIFGFGMLGLLRGLQTLAN